MSPGMKYQRGQDADTIVFRILKMLDNERLIQDTKDYIAELFKNNAGGAMRHIPCVYIRTLY